MGSASRKECLVRDVMSRVGDKWSLYVIIRLGDGTKRFGELHRSIDGISERMLAVTLRSLERDGLVARTVYPVVPPKVEYTLTANGASLLGAASHLFAWCHEHVGEVADARAAYDASAPVP
ncbi:helix-turn-helix domain-containing protein [Pseudonocardia sp. WMMC193]|uniref:winged helix-turn-helix transcriptional regulator n=1 Tax=Pseudonocardia sp. WMMC193 TaxID=2911965 RepID=UPI001F167DBA|nr:helix-turn-helix domain-containing protein [Pseudonocardia sp. WMMC193]MCF7550638.1 helix-turn-helix transcriptional regulator [Pseudonocardia sp. WMMC193]